jgi:hypothetical protein
MIQEASLAGGILTLNGAPEHTSIEDSISGSEFFINIVHPLPVAVPEPLYHGFVDFAITNPSLCRDMAIHIVSASQMFMGGIQANSNFTFDFSIWREGSRVTANGTRDAWPNIGAHEIGAAGNAIWAEILAPGAIINYQGAVGTTANKLGSQIIGTGGDFWTIKLIVKGNTI